MLNKKIVGSEAIAKYFGVSGTTVWLWKRQLNLPMYEEKGVWVAKISDIEEFKTCQRDNKFYEWEAPKKRKSK